MVKKTKIGTLFNALLITGMALYPTDKAFAAACGGISGTISYITDLPRQQGPARVVLGPSDNLYVADYRGNAIRVFDVKGVLKKTISVSMPSAVAVSSDGEIYVATGSSVIVLNKDGVYGGKTIGNNSLSFPSDIALSSDGRIFVLDADLNRVKVFSVDGSQMAEFGYGTLNLPTGLAIDEVRGRVIVTDQRNYKVRVYNLSDYALSYSFGAAQTDGNITAGTFNFMQGVAVDTEGKIYVLDSGTDTLQIFDSCYVYLGTIGRHGTGPGTLNLPVDPAVDRFGRIFVASLGDGRVSVFRDADTKNPVALSPINNSIVLSSSPSLTVKNAFINALPLTYEFQVASDTEFTTTVASNTSVTEGSGITAWQLPALNDNSLYYWKAVATEGASYTGWTQTSSFRVNALKFSGRGEEAVSENLPGSDTRPVLAADEARGTVWMAWEGNSEGNYNIYVRSFDTVKNEWGSISRVTSGQVDHVKPALAVGKNGSVWISWTEAGGVKVSSYDTGSRAWSESAAVSGYGLDANNSSIAVNAVTGEVVVSWDNVIDDKRAVYLSKYDAVRKVWGDAERITNSTFVDTEPSTIFGADGRLWVSWKRFDGTSNNDLYVKSFDSTAGWSGEVAVAANAESDEYSSRLTAAANGDIWVVYVSGGMIKARRYLSTSSAWDQETIINEGPASNPVSLIDHSGKIWIVWDSARSGNSDLYGKVFDGVWSDPLPLTSNVNSDARPSLTLQNNNLWMAWESDRNGNLDVFVNSFFIDDLPSAPALLSPAEGVAINSGNPALTASKAQDPDSAELYYQYEVDTVNTFAGSGVVRSGMVQGGGEEITWFPGTLDNGKVYYWRVRAFDGEGFGPWSQVGSFRIVTQNVPPVIEGYQPKEGSTSVVSGGSISFGITASDPNGDTLSYQWVLDGQVVSEASTYQFAAMSGKSLHKLTVSVSDGVFKVSNGWSIRVVWGGSLALATDQPGAKVYIDGNYGYPGRFLGLTPINVQGITVGDHSIAFIKEGHEAVYRQLHIDKDSSGITLSVTLLKAFKMKPAEMKSVATKDDVPVKVNGRAVPYVVDWNNDGLKDLIVGAGDGKVYLYISEALPDGKSALVPKGLLTVEGGGTMNVGSNAAPFVADWNNDGRKDLLVGGGDGRVRAYLNTGSEIDPVFGEPIGLLGSSGEIGVLGNAHPVVVDYDSDGRKDLVLGGSDGNIRLYLNSGTDEAPAFSDAAVVRVDSEEFVDTGDARPFFGDWNSDGKKDMLVGGAVSGRLFFNVDSDESPWFLSISALNDWTKDRKRDRRNRDYLPFIDYKKDMEHYVGHENGTSFFIVNWNDKGGRDILVGSGNGEVKAYLSGE